MSTIAVSDQEFREKVLEDLATLVVKTNILVGADGTGGFKKDIDERVKRLEDSRNREVGRRQVREALLASGGGLVGAVISGGLTFVAKHLWH